MLYPVSIAVGVVAVVAWLHLLLGRGWFWRLERNVFVAPRARGPFRIAVVIPARDEAATIGAAIASLVDQEGSEIHVFLVDDASTDGTAQVALDAARQVGKLERLTVIAGQPLPPGWSGKLWAVQQGIEAARALAPAFVLLTDADIVHAPGSVAALATAAHSAGHDLLSLMVKLHCESAAEKLLIPAFVFFFLKLYPPAWIQEPRRATAGAAGGCMLLRPEALVRAGGIEAVRGEIIDDCALARAVKRSGARVSLGVAPATASIRHYGSFAEIGRMIARSAFNQLRHSALLLALTVVGMAVVYLLPIALVFAGRALPVTLGVAALALMIAAYLPMIRFYGLSPLWALTLPAAALFYLGATVKSAIDFWSGRGGQWKGRAQDVHSEAHGKGTTAT